MELIERYSNPTKYDLAKYGQICKHGDKYFIQVSKNPDIANWLTLGDFCQICFQKSILSDDFLNKCLSMYEDRTSSTGKINNQETIL